LFFSLETLARTGWWPEKTVLLRPISLANVVVAGFNSVASTSSLDAITRPTCWRELSFGGRKKMLETVYEDLVTSREAAGRKALR